MSSFSELPETPSLRIAAQWLPYPENPDSDRKMPVRIISLMETERLFCLTGIYLSSNLLFSCQLSVISCQLRVVKLDDGGYI